MKTEYKEEKPKLKISWYLEGEIRYLNGNSAVSETEARARAFQGRYSGAEVELNSHCPTPANRFAEMQRMKEEIERVMSRRIKEVLVLYDERANAFFMQEEEWKTMGEEEFWKYCEASLIVPQFRICEESLGSILASRERRSRLLQAIDGVIKGN